jgi:hypothetical protein
MWKEENVIPPRLKWYLTNRYENEIAMARVGRIAPVESERFFPGHKFLDLRVFWAVEYGRLSGTPTTGQDECG